MLGQPHQHPCDLVSTQVWEAAGQQEPRDALRGAQQVQTPHQEGAQQGGTGELNSGEHIAEAD